MFASREAQTFLASLQEPERVQAEFLREQILAPNVDCELGRRYRFEEGSYREVGERREKITGH